jgi:MYXO-CTERM domain-containing protein
MSAAQIAGYAANAAKNGTAAEGLVSDCQRTIDNPGDYTARGGADGSTWPGAALSCAFAYQVTKDAKYLPQATKYLTAALEDDQDIGDKLGCIAGVNTDWRSWDGSTPTPPVIITVTHDTGYPMRWYGPYVALAYDWLSPVAGVDAGLLSQARTCLTAWSDYYTTKGYHHDEAGANYNAGFIIGKALTAIAIGNDGGADGHLWNEIVDDQFQKLLIGEGLLGMNGDVGAPAGALVGGDWAEGWQYGPLSVLEYAVAARALEENGASLPEMDAWTNSLAVRYIHATVPAGDGQWVGGDYDNDQIYQSPATNEVDAVLAGPSSDAAASWAASMKEKQSLGGGGYFYNALAELRGVTPADFTTQSPAPALWYVARGTRALYARSAWDSAAFWGVFSSAPTVVSDHGHFSASNFVFTRGADHLIVDPSTYGGYDTLSTNALTVDSDGLTGDYARTQTPWSEAELVWARGTADAVYAGRSDFAKAFKFTDKPSDIPYAHREWVMLPEGEVVTIDRVHTADAAHAMYLGLNVNSGGGGKLTLAGSTATATIGGSQIAIHAILLSGGSPTITQPPTGDCFSCSYPCGSCEAVRFAVDKYKVQVPGPFAVAIHAIDGLAAGEAQAIVGSINDDNYDPAPKQNAGVIGAAVFRGSKQTYVVASSAEDGASPATVTYGVPGDSASRHIVFDAPEDSGGKSTVTAATQNGRCVLTFSAGAGFTGHPLMFGMSSAADGCTLKEDTNVPAGVAPPNGGVTPVPGNGGQSNGGAPNGGNGGASGGGVSGGGVNGSAANPGNQPDGGPNGATSSDESGGCGCRVGNRPNDVEPVVLALCALGGLAARRRRRAPPR